MENILELKLNITDLDPRLPILLSKDSKVITLPYFLFDLKVDFINNQIKKDT